MASITFGAVTIWDQSDTGFTHQVSISPFVKRVIETENPIGTGVWTKPAGTAPITLKLELTYNNASITAVRSLLEGACANNALLTLYLPYHGTITNCLLESISAFETSKTESGFFIRTTLTFKRYP